MAKTRQINAAGLAIVKNAESWRANPYLDSDGIPTIGWGTTRLPGGGRVTLAHPQITRPEGERLLRYGLDSAEDAVGWLIRVPLNNNEFSALVSFTYNEGSGHLQASTLRMKLNRGDRAGAAGEFWKWRRAGGIILAGLVTRRAVEKALFLA